MEDTRFEARRILDRLEFSSGWGLIKTLGCVVLASVAFVSTGGTELTEAARWTLFVATLAAGMWATEAIPAFAVALMVIGLLIAILGQPGGQLGREQAVWEPFAQTLGSPLIWLFFGGFVLAAAAGKTGLNRSLAREVLRRLGNRPGPLLAGSMGVTFVFSMFISNTAAATMMIAVMTPVLAPLARGDRFRRGMLLGIAFAANIGGMGTVIGSPPNAIAAGALREIDPIDFFRWMQAAVPPALVTIVLTWAYLLYRYRPAVERLDVAAFMNSDHPPELEVWRRLLVMGIFVVTIALWLSQALHGIPSTVVAFLPICVFSAAGVLNGDDICALRWDVLLLIAGGLSLGLAVTETGLADWLVGSLPLDRVSAFAVVLLLAYVTTALSNLMSNTAAANILVPIGVVVGVGSEAATVVPLAIGASAAMCLPISTPPNAIAFGTGQLPTRDLIEGGLWIGLLAPLLATLWCSIVF